MLYLQHDIYCGQNQWQRKKQTPDQKRAARMAKLDPDNAKSAKDVMDERAAAARKRKREEEEADASSGRSSPGQVTGQATGKRRRMEANQRNVEKNLSTNTQPKRSKAEKRRAKKQAREAKKAKEGSKAEVQKDVVEPSLAEKAVKGNPGASGVDSQSRLGATISELDPKLAKDVPEEVESSSTAPSSSATDSNTQSPHHHSVSSSISSILPPSGSELAAKADALELLAPLPSTDLNSLTPQQRLEARIKSLRAARKADGPDSRQPRNRQELLEQRRRKEEERRAHKKELRRKAKEEEMRKQEEEIAKRFSPGGSGSLLASPKSPMDPSSNNFSFSRVAFGDGTQTDHNLSSLLAPRKIHGPSDTGTALRAAQNKASRLSSLDASKRQDIGEKDMWLNAKKKAHGSKVREDTNLLRKALKRQEKNKKKSEKEWQGRIEGVAKSQELRQKKRMDNINKRKEEKGAGRGGKKGERKAEKKPKVKRPGFEGSFKAKHSSKGK